MSVNTIDNTLITQSGTKVIEANSSKKITKIHVKPKKRKISIVINLYKKKFQSASNILTIFDNKVTKEVTECSYNNCLVEQLKLVVCGMKSYSKFLHHVCQNNVDQNVYHGSFELNFGLAYRCPECMTFELQPEDCKMTCNKKTSKTPKK